MEREANGNTFFSTIKSFLSLSGCIQKNTQNVFRETNTFRFALEELKIILQCSLYKGDYGMANPGEDVWQQAPLQANETKKKHLNPVSAVVTHSLNLSTQKAKEEDL